MSLAPEIGLLSIIRIERVHRVYDLREIVFCLRLSGLVLNCSESGKQQADQNRNDRDDDQQLDESERAVRSGSARASRAGDRAPRDRELFPGICFGEAPLRLCSGQASPAREGACVPRTKADICAQVPCDSGVHRRDIMLINEFAQSFRLKRFSKERRLWAAVHINMTAGKPSLLEVSAASTL